MWAAFRHLAARRVSQNGAARRTGCSRNLRFEDVDDVVGIDEMTLDTRTVITAYFNKFRHSTSQGSHRVLAKLSWNPLEALATPGN